MPKADQEDRARFVKDFETWKLEPEVSVPDAMAVDKMNFLWERMRKASDVYMGPCCIYDDDEEELQPGEECM